MKIRSIKANTLYSLLALAALVLIGSVLPAAQAAPWSTNGPMHSAHSWHTATLLPNGMVLVAGGSTNYGVGYYPTSVAELFDPSTGLWTATASMSRARLLHTATLLPNGKVLVAGGYLNIPPYDLSSAELFDPAAGTWSPTSSMNVTRGDHTATLLPNGKVLVAAGGGSINTFTNAEIYDPSNQTWTITGALHVPRQGHSAALLLNGKVLVAGGGDTGNNPIADVELYDPAVGTWTLVNPISYPRSEFTATLLPSGKVLITGGYHTISTNTAELYDPQTGAWTLTAPMHKRRVRHTATLLPNGKVLVSGGDFSSPPTSEIYDPVAQSWTFTAPLNFSRYSHSATLLANGHVLVAGGATTLTLYLSSSEIYDPTVDPATVSLPVTTMLTGALQGMNAFQVAFTNSAGASFTVLTSTNPFLPSANWTALGAAQEISPGQFQFTDPQATNSPQRFYRLRSP